MKTEQQILKEIQSGAYRDSYLIYSRKSTDEAESQKNSIAYQKAENTKLARRKHLRVASVTLRGFAASGMISERHSGFKDDTEIYFTNDGLVQYRIKRPKFRMLAQYLSQGYFKGVICLCWDRMSRNEGDNTIINKLMRSGVDVRFAFAQYDDTSSGMLHKDIDGMFAIHHSRITSEKVRTNTITLRDQGVCTYRAPIGYLNPGDMYNKPFDPDRAPQVKRLFELCAQGSWSITDLAGWANQQGLLTPPIRPRRTEEEMLAEVEVIHEQVARPLTRSHVYHILRNPFYTGRICGNGGIYVKSVSHKALVADKLFNRVQKMLTRKNTSKRYTKKLGMPYRGKVRCAHCKRFYSPYRQKGFQYFSVRCKTADCPNPRKNFNLTFLEQQVSQLLESLPFDNDRIAQFAEQIQGDISAQQQEWQQARQSRDQRKKKISDDLHYLQDNRLSLLKAGVYSPEGYADEENRLRRKLEELDDATLPEEQKLHEFRDYTVKTLELLKSAKVCYEKGNSSQKEDFAEIVFLELLVSGNTLNYMPQKGFQFLKKLFVRSGAPVTTPLELDRLDEMLESIVALEKLLKNCTTP